MLNFRKSEAFFVFALSCLFTFFLLKKSFGQSEPHLINYKTGIKVNWDDFKGVSDENHLYQAVTDWGITYSCGLEGDMLKFELICQFNKNNSWVKAGHLNDYLLNHEQRHWDLAEIYARKMRKALLENHYKLETLQQDVQQLYDQYFEQCDKEQKLYDTETNHSKNEKKQAAWDKRIQTELNRLKFYSKEKYTVKVGK
ncbi:MAG: hypothetical protein COC01_01510 [Bacteroidetes bacterium]|nr:MAG: hypothetical protein COC01_01510 [Bacteroidota bacterium]